MLSTGHGANLNVAMASDEIDGLVVTQVIIYLTFCLQMNQSKQRSDRK